MLYPLITSPLPPSTTSFLLPSLSKIPSATSSSLLSQSPFQCFYPISSYTFHHHHIQSNGSGRGNTGYTGGGGGSRDSHGNNEYNRWSDGFGSTGAFPNEWRSRVTADPQFLFKVLMTELVRVTACVFGDMATHSNFGLNKLDFVFSTLEVGSILKFFLMYLLTPITVAGRCFSSLTLTILSISSNSFQFRPFSFNTFSFNHAK